MKYKIFLPFLACFFLTACGEYVQDDYEQKYVVESFQVAQEPLADVRITTTGKIDDRLNLTANSVNNATVKVSLLKSDGSIDQSFNYVSSGAGYYRYTGTHRVLPSRTYRLDAVIGTSTISAKTAVPDTMSVLNTNGTRFTYQQEQVALTISPSVNPNRNSYFIFTVEAQEPNLSNLTSFYQASYERDPDQIPPVRYASPILNDGNYTVNADGSFNIQLPWLAVVYYGRNRGYINAIDDNLYDFFRSQSVQRGGGVISPGEIPNAIYHVDGGIGVFGSYAKAYHDVVIERNQP